MIVPFVFSALWMAIAIVKHVWGLGVVAVIGGAVLYAADKKNRRSR